VKSHKQTQQLVSRYLISCPKNNSHAAHTYLREKSIRYPIKVKSSFYEG
jgi:hypothetical protein